MWHQTWAKWISKDILQCTLMNQGYGIIYPDLKDNDQNIRHVVEQCVSKITPITNFATVTHLSNISVTWTSICGSIGSFTSVENAVLANFLQPDTLVFLQRMFLASPGLTPPPQEF